MFLRVARKIALFRPKNAKKVIAHRDVRRYIATAVRKDESPKGECIHTWQQAR
jgi:hypothetical protein